MRKLEYVITALFAWHLLIVQGYAQVDAGVLKSRLEAGRITRFIFANERFYQPTLVRSFYEARQYEPAWNNSVSIAVFLGTLLYADDEGLEPGDYHLAELCNLYELKERSQSEEVSFELLLTDAFMHYGRHLLYGKIDPAALYPGQWESVRKEADLVLLLQQALLENSIARTIESFRPQQQAYRKLREAMFRYRKLESVTDWAIIPNGPSIKLGMTDDRVLQVRRRLTTLGRYSPDQYADITVYDSALMVAVEDLQHQYGLVVDGVIGRRTLAALNTSPEDYVRKIRINMERHRWLPKLPPEDYVFVNIPSFHLEVMRADSLIMEMKAIVGRSDRMTPVFTSDIHYLILNPTWTVPPTILREDALPAIRRNISYLRRNNLRVIDIRGEEVDPSGLPWESYTANNFPYQLRQDPGPGNSLGLIKFQFPNNHKVFLHDTNLPSLFSNNYRALSSGCIRIEHPFQLASYLLRGTEWTEDRMAEVIKSGVTQTVVLPRNVPIFISYFSAFVDSDNTLQLRDDVYGWDEILIRNFF